MKHTPGPWYIEGMGNLPNAVAITAGKQVDGPEFQREDMLAEVYGEATDPNALLIAAAPDMLAALQYMVEHFQFAPLGVGCIKACEAARAAIAKATKG